MTSEPREPNQGRKRIQQLYDALDRGRAKAQTVSAEYRSFAKRLVTRFADFLGEPKAVSWVPVDVEKPDLGVTCFPDDAMKFDEDGWLRVSFRLMVGHQPFLVRMFIRKDGDCWSVKPYADSKTYRVEGEEASWQTFHQNLLTIIADWIESVGDSPKRVGFATPSSD